MKYKITISAQYLMSLIVIIFVATACSEAVIPSDLPGTYSGKEIVMLRYDKDGQYINKDDIIQVSLIISNTGEVSGTLGETAFEGCKVTLNRGWLSRQLNIKTDFIVNGKLNGRTFEEDTMLNKNISIPFNLKNREISGRLFINNNGQNYPVISNLKLIKL